MSPTSHRSELDLLRRQVADLTRELAERDRVLHERTRHIHVAQALAHLGSWNWDITSGEVEWSDELYRIFGYDPHSREMTFDSFVSAVFPDDHDRVLASIDDALAETAPYDMECRIVRPDGEVRTIHCCGEVVRDGSGQPLRMSGTALDITDRKRMEASIRESEEWYRTLVELSPSGVFVFSEGRIAYVNHTGAVLLGAKDAQEVLDRPTFAFIHPDYHQDVRKNVERLLSGGVSVHSTERIYLKLDGAPIPVQVEAARITWNDKPAILGLFSDITERKQAEQTLWKSRQAIRALYDISSAPGQSFKERIEALLQLGCRFFDLPIGMETFVRGDELEVGQVNAPGMAFHPGMRVSRSQAYCDESLRRSGPVCFEHAGASPEWRRHPGYAALKLESYIGTAINGLERTYGTLCFASVEPRNKPFTDSERDFIQLMARWLGGEMDRRSALDALRQSEERYRTLYDETPSMYFTVNGTGIIKSVNQYGAQYLGYRVEDLVGKSVAGIFFEGDRERVCAEMEAFFRCPEGVAQWEFRKVRSDGAVLWVREIARVVQSGEGEALALIVCEDVTERKRDEDRVREMNLALAQAMPGIARVDVDGRYLEVNQLYAAMLGYEPSELLGRPWEPTVHPEDLYIAQHAYGQLLENGKAEFECRAVRKDGSTFFKQVLVVRSTLSVGGVLGHHCFMRDITERKQSEKALADLNATLEQQVCDRTQALRRSEERFRQFFDNAPNVTALKDHNGRYVYTNRQFDKACRLSPGIAIGKTDEEVFSFEQATLFQSHDQQVLLNGRGQEFEEVTSQEDGSHISIVVRFPVTDASGQFSGLGIIATDITDRRRTQGRLRLAEEALRIAHDELERKVIERTAELQASEERYARATAIGKVGVWELDVIKGEYRADANLKALFGYAPEELSTDPYVWLNLVCPEDQPIAMKNWELVQSGAADACHYELRMVKKSGSMVWTDVRGHSVRDQTGRLTHLIGATVDITERKQAERALRESEERFAKAFRTSPHPIGITEVATGRCLEVNDACLQLFGFHREEVIGNTTLMLGIWPTLEDRVRVIERLKAGQQVRNMEFVLKTKSGVLRHLLASADLAELNGTLCVVTVANDITDRKQAEEALRISEERFAKAFKASPHPVVISELDSGRVVDANDAAYRMFGYRREEVEGQTTLQVGLWPSPEERARFVEQLKRVGSVRNVEVTLRSRDGEIRQCLVSSELIELNGKQCSVTVGDDVTESKRMERALRLTQFSVDQAVETILWLDPSGRIFNVNESACRMLEYSRQDLMTMTVHDIDPNFPVGRWVDHWNYLKQQGALTFEAKFWSRAGRILETDVTVKYLQHEGKEYGCMILRDVGERKRAEAELHRSHTFLRQVIDTDPDLIFAKDRAGRFTMANKAVAEWYGSTVEGLIGKSDADFNANAEEVEHFRKSDLEVIQSGRDRFIPEERITDAGGRIRWLQTVKRPICDDQGRVHMVLGTATDITERKRMEEILLQRERDLSAALQERERISQDLHDGILQSLYAVGLGLEACKPLIKKQHDRVAGKFMATLDHAIGQLNQVMPEVRNFIAGLESQVMQGGDFSTALRTMVETMSISSSARCRVRIDDAAAQRLSTEQALHIINIVREGVSNSLRHSRAKQITVSLRDLLRSDRLAVTDDGIGFNTRSVHGVGHGLINMAARAQKVRGLFAIQSKPDKGTRISLDLPKDTHYAHN